MAHVVFPMVVLVWTTLRSCTGKGRRNTKREMGSREFKVCVFSLVTFLHRVNREDEMR